MPSSSPTNRVSPISHAISLPLSELLPSSAVVLVSTPSPVELEDSLPTLVVVELPSDETDSPPSVVGAAEASSPQAIADALARTVASSENPRVRPRGRDIVVIRGKTADAAI
jgi:hypothetical protein